PSSRPLPSLTIILPLPPLPALFPYTTLFRSCGREPGTATFTAPSVRPSTGRIVSKETSIPGSSPEGVPLRRERSAVTVAVEMVRSEEHTSELQSRFDLVCRLLLEKTNYTSTT